jgi:hypothetical protein
VVLIISIHVLRKEEEEELLNIKKLLGCPNVIHGALIAPSGHRFSCTGCTG